MLENVVGLHYLEDLLRDNGLSRTRAALSVACRNGRIAAKRLDGRGSWILTKHEAHVELERVRRKGGLDSL